MDVIIVDHPDFGNRINGGIEDVQNDLRVVIQNYSTFVEFIQRSSENTLDASSDSMIAPGAPSQSRREAPGESSGQGQANFPGSRGNNTDTIEEPWHLPSNDLTFLASVNFGQKFKLNAGTHFLSGIVAQNPATNLTISLESIIDVDLGLEYLISKQASVFVNSYNIIGKEYQRYLNYPSRGLQLLAGLSYSF